MAIPDYQSLMLPVLRAHVGASDRGTQELVDLVAAELELTPEELDQRIRSGPPVFRRRVEWARYYLLRAGLLERTGRGRSRLSDRGRGVLEESPARIDNSFLSRYPEFVEWIAGSRSSGAAPQQEHPPPRRDQPTATARAEESLSPEELLEEAHGALRQAVETELLNRIKEMSPAFFEELVVQFLLRLGYGGELGSGESLGRSGDGGVDGVIRQDPLGLDVVYVQAKRWEHTVGRPLVQAFSGSLDGQRARKGVLITTSSFTDDAREYVERIEKRIVLIDGTELARLMFDHGLGVDTVRTYEVKRVDSDFFDEEEIT